MCCEGFRDRQPQSRGICPDPVPSIFLFKNLKIRYTWRESERERESEIYIYTHTHTQTCVYVLCQVDRLPKVQAVAPIMFDMCALLEILNPSAPRHAFSPSLFDIYGREVSDLQPQSTSVCSGPARHQCGERLPEHNPDLV